MFSSEKQLVYTDFNKLKSDLEHVLSNFTKRNQTPYFNLTCLLQSKNHGCFIFHEGYEYNPFDKDTETHSEQFENFDEMMTCYQELCALLSKYDDSTYCTNIKYTCHSHNGRPTIKITAYRHLICEANPYSLYNLSKIFGIPFLFGTSLFTTLCLIQKAII